MNLCHSISTGLSAIYSYVFLSFGHKSAAMMLQITVLVLETSSTGQTHIRQGYFCRQRNLVSYAKVLWLQTCPDHHSSASVLDSFFACARKPFLVSNSAPLCGNMTTWSHLIKVFLFGSKPKLCCFF